MPAFRWTIPLTTDYPAKSGCYIDSSTIDFRAVRSRTVNAYVDVNGVITDAAHAVIPVDDHGEEAGLNDADLFRAEEAFFTSTTKEIVPVVQVDEMKIGDGRVGPVTKRLLAEYRREAERLSRRV